MAHVRQQIRYAIAAAMTGLPSSGANVFVMRPAERPIPQASLPAWRIYMDDEQVEAISLEFPATQQRQPVLRLEAISERIGGTPVQDTLDTMTSEAEAALSTDPTLGGLIKWMELTDIGTAMDAEGERPVGVQTLSFQLQYMTAATAPDVAL